ncbi:MAG TPA: hypothetical protein VMR49_01785 [Candidatus Paceibacterota bacterium]|jgi:hypothetical protein|nr:hypothetical protein [Candidatus Paceibacterota bacterium]
MKKIVLISVLLLVLANISRAQKDITVKMQFNGVGLQIVLPVLFDHRITMDQLLKEQKGPHYVQDDLEGAIKVGDFKETVKDTTVVNTEVTIIYNPNLSAKELKVQIVKEGLCSLTIKEFLEFGLQYPYLLSRMCNIMSIENYNGKYPVMGSDRDNANLWAIMSRNKISDWYITKKK